MINIWILKKNKRDFESEDYNIIVGFKERKSM